MHVFLVIILITWLVLDLIGPFYVRHRGEKFLNSLRSIKSPPLLAINVAVVPFPAISAVGEDAPDKRKDAPRDSRKRTAPIAVLDTRRARLNSG